MNPMTEVAAMDELSTPYALTADQIAAYKQNGYVKLKEVFSPALLATFGAQIARVVQERNTQHLPLAERGTYAKAFLQITNLWEHDAKVKEFVMAKRLGQIAAQLMQVRGVRLYHDQALFKEPGGGFTPWHADQYYWPMSNDNTVTAWIPLQPVPLAMGPLAFCIGSQQILSNRDIAISDESEQKINRSLTDYPKDETAYELGEVSFHAGWTFHRAGPNQTDQMRGVMTIIYMEDGMVVGEPKNQAQARDWERWLPGAQLGKVIDTPLNPVIWRR
ncbi:MAG: phytanoyl-CoA dioxygenase family protein [Caldilineaceae bacterium]